MLEVLVLAFVVGLVLGLLIPFEVRFPILQFCWKSPTKKHQFMILKGAYGHCSFCTARKRFLNV